LTALADARSFAIAVILITFSFPVDQTGQPLAFWHTLNILHFSYHIAEYDLH